MPNCYCTPTEVKVFVDADPDGTTDDALLLRLCEAASRFVESERITGRQFYETSETRYYDWMDYYRVNLDRALISCTTLTNNSSAVSSDDYRLMPRNDDPKLWIEMLIGSGTVFTYQTRKADATNVVGLWGYHDDPDNRWEDSGDDVADDPSISATATSLTVTDADNFEVGQTIKMGTEQCYISASNTTTNVLTIERGLNGTTAAIHLKDVDIYIYRPMFSVRHATELIVAQLYKMRDSMPWGRIEYIDVGTIQQVAGVPEIAKDMLSRYRRVDV